MKAVTHDAYDLFHDGTLALAEVEHAGMCIDVDRLDRAVEGAGRKIRQLEDRLKQSEEWVVWRKRYKDKASLGSRVQLAAVLFEEMGYKCTVKTEKGRPKVDEAVLETIDSQFVRDFLNVEKLKKLRGTYLVGIRREVCDGYLHPSFNLHLVQTMRSSCDKPNFQNIPIRDPKVGKPIRSCFVPRDGHALVEIDYGALEFRICACFWRDAAMIEYASDPTLDVHRDMAAECYAVSVEEVTKQARFHAKNGFVFPTLYGSWYKNTARSLWSVMEANKLTDASGRPLRERLKEQGVAKSNYEEYVEGVEQRFQDRFPDWAQRKEAWWKKYLETGRFRLLTGFEIEGVYSRNNLYNYPIQGPAFHILLWSMIRLVGWSRKRRTKIVGQIHDSIVADVHLDELFDYLQEAKRVMTQDVREHWKWIVTPLEIEVEVAEDNWFNKKAIDV